MDTKHRDTTQDSWTMKIDADVSTERTEKQSELKDEKMKSQQRIQEKQKKVQELKQAVDKIKSRAQTAVEDSEGIFSEMISSMEKKRSEVIELIRAQEKAELNRAEQLLKQLELEITDLKRRVTELEQLLHTHDRMHFFQGFRSEKAIQGFLRGGIQQNPSTCCSSSEDFSLRAKEQRRFSEIFLLYDSGSKHST
ncbi:hypothetical protein KOW79_020502 [Hemibagrus wyckioides]|uniref:TRIM8/14/16/25/29/45/65 coiled-coil region domain-containing protein n=1 Tax=Hemibagrus wyckioides TaxID=337641 RepID=A0A9D3S8W1_9TELE|nr:hypothetical protein KOW79_020502 [Hemibagrus wyckioides]